MCTVDPRGTNPIDKYFADFKRSQWGISHFMEIYPGENRQTLGDRWVRSLRTIVENKNRSEAEINTAQRLLNKYLVSHEDSRAADAASRHTPPSHISINNCENLHSHVFSQPPETGLFVHPPQATQRAPLLKRKRRALPQGPRKGKRLTMPSQLPVKHQDHFQSRLATIENLWIIDPKKPSVEERLGQYVQSHNTRESPAHSLILDTGDDDVHRLFGDDEWDQIMQKVQSLPDTDETLSKYLDLFLKRRSVDAMKDILDQGPYITVSDTHLSPSEKREKYRCLAWAHHVLSCMTLDLETGYIALPDNREKWYQTHVWTPLFDRLFESIPHVRFLSGECPTNATAFRKNPNGKSSGIRRNPGCLHDGVIKYCDHEIGVVENGGCNVRCGDDKWTTDTLKLTKSNRDMIVNFHSRFGVAGGNIPALGIVTGGLDFGTLRMGYGGGSVCVLVHDPVITLPTMVHHFAPTKEAILHMWKIKIMTEQITDNITNLLSTSGGTRHPPTALLLGSMDTDPPTEEGSESDVYEASE